MNSEKLLAPPDGRTRVRARRQPHFLHCRYFLLWYAHCRRCFTFQACSDIEGCTFYCSNPPRVRQYFATRADYNLRCHNCTRHICTSRPSSPDLMLYINGGSFGTSAAQMLYGAPFDTFRHLKVLLLIAAFPPFQNDKAKGFVYTRSMPRYSYVGIGPPSRFIPFRLLQHSAKHVIQSKISS